MIINLILKLRLIIGLLILMTVWQAVALAELVNPKYFPRIDAIVVAFRDMIAEDNLLEAAQLTFSRAFMGLIGASALGIGLAILSEVLPWFRLGFRVIANVLLPIPPAALVPMAIFMLGLGPELYAFIILMVAVWPPFLNGVAALHGTNDVQLRTARMLGCTDWQTLWQVRLPAAMPEIFAGIRYAATICLIAAIVCEMLAGRDGLGFMLFKKAFGQRIPDVFALMFLCALMGAVLNGATNFARHWVTGWNLKMQEVAR